jgi:adhesin transport system outer membrane protein
MRQAGARTSGLLRNAAVAGLTLGLGLAAGATLAKEEIILLPEDDGTTGQIFITAGSDTVEVTEERTKVTLYARFLQPFIDRNVSQAAIQSAYGSILGIIVGPDNPLDTLPEIVELTLASHPAFMEKVHERQALDYYTSEAYSSFTPRINARGEYGREWTRDPTTYALGDDDFVNLQRREITVELRQMLFDGGSSFSEYDRRVADADASAYQLQALAEQLASQVADAYMDLLRDNDLLELANQNLGRLQEIEGRIGARSDSGAGNLSDLDQAVARVAAAQSAVINREQALRDSMVRYITLVGYPPVKVLIRPETTKDGLPATLDEAVAYAVENHPSIIATEADMEATRQQIRNARSLNWPRLELLIAKRYGDDLDGVEGYDEDFRVMFNLNYNLYNGNADQAKIRRSLARQQQARELREDATRDVTEAVRQAWNGFTQIERRLAALERHVAATVKARDAYGEQFKIGDRTLLDLLDSDNELFQAQSNLIEARRDYATSIYRLRASMGTLVEHFAATIPREAQPTVQYARTP